MAKNPVRAQAPSRMATPGQLGEPPCRDIHRSVETAADRGPGTSTWAPAWTPAR